MPNAFAEIAFTPTVKKLQELHGSRASYARGEAAAERIHENLGPVESAFLAARDSFYMASVGETGWPYIQHRGGPPGFVRVLDARTIGFVDYRGNRQYISVGNLLGDDRVALFFMDYANRTRLKLFGRVRIAESDDQEAMAMLGADEARARVERGLVVRVEGFDWNCPQHITPRFSAEEVGATTAPLEARIAELEAELARLRGPSAG